jgi:hypothetical protein
MVQATMANKKESKQNEVTNQFLLQSVNFFQQQRVFLGFLKMSHLGSYIFYWAVLILSKIVGKTATPAT